MGPPVVVRPGAHLLAAVRVVPLLRRVVCVLPARADGQRQHRRVADGLHEHAGTRDTDSDGRVGTHCGGQAEAARRRRGPRSRGRREQEGTVKIQQHIARRHVSQQFDAKFFTAGAGILQHYVR